MLRLAAAISILALCGTTLAAPFTAERLFGVGDATPVGEVFSLGAISINDSGDWAAMYSGFYGDDLSGGGIRSSTGFNILPGTTGLSYDGGEYILTTMWDIDINPNGQVAVATAGIDIQNQLVLNGVILNGEARFDIAGAYSSHEFLGQPTRFGAPRFIEYIDNNRIVLNSQSPDMAPGPNVGVNLISRITFGVDGSFTDEPMSAPDQVVADGVSVFRVEGTSIGTRVNRNGDVITFAGLFGAPQGLGFMMNGQLFFDGTSEVVPGQSILLSRGGMIDHNDEGQWAASVSISTGGLSSEPILFRESGEIFIRGHERQDWLGDRYALPSGIDLVDGGDLVWSATLTDDLQDPSYSVGLFFNKSLLLEENVTEIDGKIVTVFGRPGSRGFEISPNGDWIATTLVFEDGSTAFYRLRIPTPGSATVCLILSASVLTRRSR